jgi:nitrogen-specific signal transduction histidine kinase/CheY-like chemotaxis protein
LLHAVELRLLAAERSKLDRRAAELDRYGSMGVLAAGIAHEINNPLAVVTGNVDLAIQLLTQLSAWEAPPSPEALARAVSLLRDARLGAGRVATVVRAVATFSHPPDTRTSVVNLAQVLESSIRLVENEVRHRAKLVCEFDDQLRVVGNTAQLGQVFINLLTNAAHAIEEGNPAGNGIRVAGWRTAEGRTVVEVSDTGRGIPPGQIARVFDPFFTTTDAERGGLGLGLAVSQRLIAAANGVISVRSVHGSGASFRVDLPSYVPPVVTAPAAAPSGPVPRIPERLRVMIIDDEPLLLDMLAGVLADDCDVTTFAAPRAALAALRADRAWDVVLSDIMMPELSGMDLYAEVTHELPELTHRFVFMTGGTFTARTQAFVQSLPQEPLLKPFGREAALTRIRRTAMMATAYELEARTANPAHQDSEGSAPGLARDKVK